MVWYDSERWILRRLKNHVGSTLRGELSCPDSKDEAEGYKKSTLRSIRKASSRRATPVPNTRARYKTVASTFWPSKMVILLTIKNAPSEFPSKIKVSMPVTNVVRPTITLPLNPKSKATEKVNNKKDPYNKAPPSRIMTAMN